MKYDIGDKIISPDGFTGIINGSCCSAGYIVEWIYPDGNHRIGDQSIRFVENDCRPFNEGPTIERKIIICEGNEDIVEYHKPSNKKASVLLQIHSNDEGDYGLWISVDEFNKLLRSMNKLSKEISKEN